MCPAKGGQGIGGLRSYKRSMGILNGEYPHPSSDAAKEHAAPSIGVFAEVDVTAIGTYLESKSVWRICGPMSTPW